MFSFLIGILLFCVPPPLLVLLEKLVKWSKGGSQIMQKLSVITE